MKLLRLRGRKTADLVRRKGDAWKSERMVVRVLDGAPRNEPNARERGCVYAGTYAPSKLHKSAVKRNRMRRRCREALRTELAKLDDLPTMRLLISPRSSSLDCEFADIVSDVRSFLSQFESDGRESKEIVAA